MKRRNLLSIAAGSAVAVALPGWSQGPLPAMEVYRSPTCGCCGAWVEHLKAAGFSVKVFEVDDTSAARKRLGMPAEFGSCHTGLVGGYVVEGHVPAKDIRRLLNTRLSAIGLAVPGMPVGSPGMEVGSQQDAYDVLLIDKRGRGSVFAHYPKT